MFTQEFLDSVYTIVYHLDKNFSADEARMRQAVALGEEVGEALGAIRRYMGWARRNGDFSDVEQELADVVITAAVTMVVFDMSDPNKIIADKLQKILTRGWKEPRKSVDNLVPQPLD